MTSTLGVVVVGVGMAGKVRIRDLQAASTIPQLSRLKLQGFVSRRELEIEGARQLNLDEALSDPSVNILLICTENEQHEPTARKALEAGKHVLVEYPLALTAPKAQALKDYAAQKGLVCYEEDIALLTDQHLYMKELVKTKPALLEGEFWLEARFNGWIEDVARSGSAFHTSINQIHRLLHYFGDLQPVDAKIVRGEKSVETQGTVKTADGGLIKLRVERELLDTPKRKSGFTLRFSDDSVIDSGTLVIPPQENKPPKLGLFLQDLVQFVEVIEGGRDGGPLSDVTIRGLQTADQLYDMARQNSDSKM